MTDLSAHADYPECLHCFARQRHDWRHVPMLKTKAPYWGDLFVAGLVLFCLVAVASVPALIRWMPH